jgi:hypothetical protein
MHALRVLRLKLLATAISMLGADGALPEPDPKPSRKVGQQQKVSPTNRSVMTSAARLRRPPR